MSDRGNIVFVQPGGIDNAPRPLVYLYSHWGGSELAETLQRALKRGVSRWDDNSYLARIVFCTMCAGDVEGLTGFGISAYMPSAYMPDNAIGRALLVVDCEKKTVYTASSRAPLEPVETTTFERYVALTAKELAAFCGQERNDD